MRYTTLSLMEIPFTFAHNQIIVQPELPGLGIVTMLLDTGTDPSAVDLTFAKQSGLPLSPLNETGEGAGTQAVTIFATETLELKLGDLVASKLVALGVDLSKVAGRLGQPLQGVLGYSFLANRIVQIDYPQQVLRFFLERADYDAFQTSTDRQLEVPMRLWDNCPLIEQAYVNHQAIRATLDTGSSGTLTLFPAAIQYLGLAQAVDAGASVSSVGYGGREDNRKGLVDSFAIADWDFGPTEVTFVLSGNRAKTPLAERGGNIGNGWLKDRVLTLDYQNQRIFLSLPAQA